MNTNLIFDFTVNRENKTIAVKREFDAPLSKVWAAWTQSELLDQWKEKILKMSFKEGFVMQLGNLDELLKTI